MLMEVANTVMLLHVTTFCEWLLWSEESWCSKLVSALMRHWPALLTLPLLSCVERLHEQYLVSYNNEIVLSSCLVSGWCLSSVVVQGLPTYRLQMGMLNHLRQTGTGQVGPTGLGSQTIMPENLNANGKAVYCVCLKS